MQISNPNDHCQMIISSEINLQKQKLKQETVIKMRINIYIFLLF